MKKSLLFLLTVVSMALLASCGSSKEKSKGDDVNGEIIKNEKFGYSVLVPDVFKNGKGGSVHVQESSGSASEGGGDNDEQCRGFSCEEYDFNICARSMDYIGGTTPEQSIKQSFEMMKSQYRNPEAKIIDDESFVVIGEKGSMLYADIEFQKKGNKYTIKMSYPADEKDEFEEVVDAVIESFEVE